VTRATSAPLVSDARHGGVATGAGRLTPRARRVLAILTGRETPLTAHQLYLELREAGERIGRTTVYRALHALGDAGLVHEFRSDGDETSYRACTPGPHDHLVCTGCGRIQELHLAGLDDSLTAVREEGFLVAGRRVEVHGLCPRCTAARPATAQLGP
jgi:Fur family ferric uptake transcriptional regulator